MLTTMPAPQSGPRTHALSQTRQLENLSLRTASLFVTPSVAPRNHRYSALVHRALLERGNHLLGAVAETPSATHPATVRLIPPLLNQRLVAASSRAEAAAVAREEFAMREDAACELNQRIRNFGFNHGMQVFLGGFGIAAHGLPDYVIEGFLEVVVTDLSKSRWQFGLAALGGSELGVHQFAVDRAAEAIALLGVGGARFAVMFGDAAHTPFCPCAQHSEAIEGLAIGMSSPGLLYDALQSEPRADLAEEAVYQAQFKALLIASAVGSAVANKLGVRYWGCDPSQAPVFDPQEPRRQSIGAVIEQLSGVPLGLAGTKDGFYRLMRALRSAGANSGVRLCGFINGSFLPVAEDAVVAAAVAAGTLSYSGILSLCHVCAAGIDMAVIEPGTSPLKIAHVLRDVAATHLLKGKALAARLIVPGRDTPTDGRGYYVFGGLLGSAPVLPLD